MKHLSDIFPQCLSANIIAVFFSLSLLIHTFTKVNTGYANLLQNAGIYFIVKQTNYNSETNKLYWTWKQAICIHVRN